MSSPEPPEQPVSPAEGPPGEPTPTGRRLPWIQRPLLYILLLVFYVADQEWRFLPAPAPLKQGQVAEGSQPKTFEDLFSGFRAAPEIPVAALVVFIVLFVLGLTLLLGYLILRACNIRVFPRCDFRPAAWDGWHLVRFAIVFLVVWRLAAAAVAVVDQHMGEAAEGASAVLVPLLTVNVAMIGLCLFLLAMVGSGGGNPFRALGLVERRPLNRIVVGIGGFIMIFPLFYLANIVMVIFGPLIGIRPETQKLLLAARQIPAGAFLVMMVSGVLVAAVTEEIVFRGFLYTTLRRYMGPLQAICLSAAAFALMHQFKFGFLGLFVIGFLLGYLYERTGSLVASMSAHAINNSYSFLMIVLVYRSGGG